MALIEDEIQNIIDILTLNIIDAFKVIMHFNGNYCISVTTKYNHFLVKIKVDIYSFELLPSMKSLIKHSYF